VDRSELKRWVRQELNLSDATFSPIWSHLESSGYVGNVLNEGDPLEGLVKDARDLVELARAVHSAMAPGRSNRIAVQAEVKEQERLRASLTHAYRNDLAERSPEVIRLRDDVLEGRTITIEQAHLVVTSPATATLRLEVLLDHRVPVVGHTARFNTGDEQRNGDLIMRRSGIDVDPPGVHIPTPITYRVGNGPHRVWSRILEYLDEDGRPMRVRIAPGSVLDRLRDASERLSTEVRWSEAQAARYILTGDAPEPDPVAAYVNRFDGTISVEAQHWVSAETMGRYYRRAQQEFATGTDNRKGADIKLVVALFVEKHRDQGGKLPTWEKLLAGWNRDHPGHRYSNRGALHKAYREGRKAMAPLGVKYD
jgi:hypothetical protein